MKGSALCSTSYIKINTNEILKYLKLVLRSGYSSGSRTQLYCAIRPALPVCARENSG